MAEVVVTGDPFGGLTIHGPFWAEGDGQDWADQTFNLDTWWVVQVHPIELDEGDGPVAAVLARPDIRHLVEEARGLLDGSEPADVHPEYARALAELTMRYAGLTDDDKTAVAAEIFAGGR